MTTPLPTDYEDGDPINAALVNGWMDTINDNFASVEVGAVDLGASTHGATAKTVPVDADEFFLADSNASYGTKKVTFGNLQKAMGPFFNAAKFGVKQDGVTDDTAAWALATQAVWDAGGGTILLPPSANYSMVTGPVYTRPPLTHSGTAQAGASSTITLASGASSADTDYSYAMVKITGGTGSGQVRKISSYNGTTKVATVSIAWTTAPNNTSTYTVQYTAGTIRAIDIIGVNPYASKIQAASGFVDPSFDGREYVLRCDAAVNDRYASIYNIQVNANSNADHAMSVAGVVERKFGNLWLRNGVISQLDVDGSQNCVFEGFLHTDGGQYGTVLLNGAGSNYFERSENVLMTDAGILFDKDVNARMAGWIPGLSVPFFNVFDRGLAEAPPTGSPGMIPLLVKAGYLNEFRTFNFATYRYSSGTQSTAVVQMGDGSGTNTIYGNTLTECTFSRNGDTAAGNYVVVEDSAFETAVVRGKWTGGFTGVESAAIRASEPVKITSPLLLDQPKAFIDQVNGADGAYIQVLQSHVISGTTAQRPNYGTTPHGARPPYYNTDTPAWEAMAAGTWANLGGGGGGGGGTPDDGTVTTPKFAAGSLTTSSETVGSNDSDTQVPTTAATKLYADTITANPQSGTSYTLALSDRGKTIECNNASPFTLTVPLNSSAAFPVGTVIAIDQIGAGQVTVAAAGGVTLQSKSSHVKLGGQYAGAALRKRATNTWVLTGDLTA